MSLVFVLEVGPGSRSGHGGGTRLQVVLITTTKRNDTRIEKVIETYRKEVECDEGGLVELVLLVRVVAIYTVWVGSGLLGRVT